MDIQTKDGILLRNIPDGTPDEEIKARIAKIRGEPAIPQNANPSLVDVATGPATLGDWFSGRVAAAKEVASPEYLSGIAKELGNFPKAPKLTRQESAGDKKLFDEALNMAMSVNPVTAMPKAVMASMVNAPQKTVSPVMEAAREASGAGYVIPPAQVGGKGTALLESLGGKLLTEQKASLKNVEVTNRLAKRALGLADDVQLTDDILNGIKKTAGGAYDKLKGAGRFLADKQFADDVNNAAGGYRAFTQEFPELASKEVDNLLAAFNKPDMSANGLVEGVKKLRFDAGKNMKSLDPEKVTLGRIQKKVANAVEDLMERNLDARGMGDIVKNFREGRTMYAKASTIQEALDEAGNVSATALAKMMDKGKPMSGAMQQIAKFGATFPKAAQDIKRSMLPGSPLDWAVSGSVSAITQNPAYMAMTAARPAARSLLLSKPYQNMIMREAAPLTGNTTSKSSEMLARLIASLQEQ